MNATLKVQWASLCLVAAGALPPTLALSQDLLVKPSRGGGLDSNAPMIHVDVFYDYTANQMHATLDTNYGLAKLVPLPPGYAFDSRSNYAVLSGKAHNFQYAWNPGGVFSPPAGAAVWIERLDGSPELETYDGPGNKMENPPRSYAPIFGTAGTSAKWSWYGRMAHNSYAVRNPATNLVWADYRVYFGDAVTGSREGYSGYGDATVRLTWTVEPVILASTSRGGGVGTNPPPMVHVDIFYDYTANQMHATLDTNYGIAKLVPLPLGYAFDTRSNYSVLNGKAYNFQYAWNPGGVFSPPAGAAVWIERLSFSPGLENYDGPGNKMENPPRTFAPILGTAGTPLIWKWYGRMAHNVYAILNPTTNVLTAEFRVYFGDAVTGSREGYTQYDDATVTLTWTVDPMPEAPVLQFGAEGTDEDAPLCWLNAPRFGTNGECVVTLHPTNTGPCAGRYEGCVGLTAVAATAAHGGPAPNHAALGACVELEFVSLSGPAGGSLGFWEATEAQPRFQVPVGETRGTNRCRLSATQGEPGADPYGNLSGRRFAVSQPGLYCLGFRAVDTSANGAGGGPIHEDSTVQYLYLQAGLVLNAITRQGTSATASFGGEPGKNFYLERTTALGPAATWQVVAGPLRGFDRLQTLKDAGANAGQGFYRLRASVP